MSSRPAPDPSSLQSRQEFAAALTDLKVQAGLSVRGVAKMAGLSSSTVGGYFSGAHLPELPPQTGLREVLGACGVADEEVLEGWEEALRRLHRAPGPRSAAAPVPFRGLESFREQDASWFVGREREVEAVLATVRRLAADAGTGGTDAGGAGTARIAAVVGASGSGKSSLLCAGVIARLRRGDDGSEDDGAEVVLLTPGVHPVAELERARSAAGPDVQLVVVDQFEELFTTCQDAAERVAFVHTLHALSRTDAPVLIGLRADFYRQAIAHPELRPALEEAQTVLAPMSREQLRRAITEPAVRAGGQVDDALVEVLLAETEAADAGALPLLEHVLLVMWQQTRRSLLTITEYKATGGLRQAVAETAERAYGQLTPPQQEAARRLFLRLVALGDGTPDTRRRADPGELAGPDLGPALTVFLAHRLLTSSDRGVEITHEVLLRTWPRLQSWVDADRAGLRLRRGITEAARTWESLDRDPSALLRGVRLEAALQVLAEPDAEHDLTDGERAFVRASEATWQAERHREARQARRLRALAGTLAVLLIAAVGLAGWSAHLTRTSRQERDLALSRQVAAASDRLRSTDTSLAAQLAVVAYRTAPTVEARSAVLDSSATATARRYLGPRGVLQAVARSSNGRVLAGGSESGTVRVWVTPSPGAAPVSVDRQNPNGGTVFAVALTPDGRTLATGGTGGVRLWDLTDPRSPALLPPLPGAPTSTVFSLVLEPGGTRLIAAGASGALRRWDVTDARRPRALPAPTVPADAELRSVAVSPDGRLLAAGSADGVTRLWRVDGAAPAPTPTMAPGPAAGVVYALAFAPDGRSLAAGSADRLTYLWRLTPPTGSAAPPQLIHSRTLAGPTGWVNAVAFSPDGTRLAAGSSDSLAWQWNIDNGHLVAQYPHPGPVTALSFSGEDLLTAAADGAARVWPSTPPRLAVAGKHFSVSFATDGRLMAAGASANEAGLVDVRVPERPRFTAPPLLGPGGAARLAGPAALTRDGRTLVTGGKDGSLLLWNVSDPTHPAAIGGPFAADGLVVQSVTFSPDGHTLAVGGDDSVVRLFDVSDRAHPRLIGDPLPGGGLVFTVAFSPDGRRLAAGNSNHAVLQWDVTNPTAPRPLGRPITHAESYIWGIAWSPDGRTLAAGSADRSVWVWDVTIPDRATVRARLTEATNYVWSVAFAPDGRTLAAASSDQTVRLWRVPTSGPAFEHLATLTAAGDDVLSVGFTPDSQTLVAGTNSGLVFWRTSPRPLTQVICGSAGETITAHEWRRYLPGRAHRNVCSS